MQGFTGLLVTAVQRGHTGDVGARRVHPADFHLGEGCRANPPRRYRRPDLRMFTRVQSRRTGALAADKLGMSASLLTTPVGLRSRMDAVGPR